MRDPLLLRSESLAHHARETRHDFRPAYEEGAGPTSYTSVEDGFDSQAPS
jgi:hypothetical protein